MSLLAQLRECDLRNLDQASPGIRSLVLALLALVIMVSGYVFVIGPQRVALHALRASVDAQAAELLTVRAMIAAAPEMEHRVQELQATDAVIALSGGFEIPALLDHLAQRAGALSIETELFEPGPEQLDEPYIQRPVKLRLRGNYHALGRFAAELAALDYPVVLRQFELAPADQGQLRLEGELHVLRAQDGGSPPSLAVIDSAPEPHYAAAGLPDPFSAASPLSAAPAQPTPDLQRQREPLERFPLSALTMAGTLAAGGQRWALIVDGDGRVHRVAPGDRLGPDDGRVTGIADDRIEIEEQVPDGTGGWRRRHATIARRRE